MPFPCPHCGYDVVGLPGSPDPVCPECGRIARADERPKPRWIVRAFFAMLTPWVMALVVTVLLISLRSPESIAGVVPIIGWTAASLSGIATGWSLRRAGVRRQDVVAVALAWGLSAAVGLAAARFVAVVLAAAAC